MPRTSLDDLADLVTVVTIRKLKRVLQLVCSRADSHRRADRSWFPCGLAALRRKVPAGYRVSPGTTAAPANSDKGKPNECPWPWSRCLRNERPGRTGEVSGISIA